MSFGFKNLKKPPYSQVKSPRQSQNNMFGVPFTKKKSVKAQHQNNGVNILHKKNTTFKAPHRNLVIPQKKTYKPVFKQPKKSVRNIKKITQTPRNITRNKTSVLSEDLIKKINEIIKKNTNITSHTVTVEIVNYRILLDDVVLGFSFKPITYNKLFEYLYGHGSKVLISPHLLNNDDIKKLQKIVIELKNNESKRLKRVTIHNDIFNEIHNIVLKINGTGTYVCSPTKCILLFMDNTNLPINQMIEIIRETSINIGIERIGIKSYLKTENHEKKTSKPSAIPSPAKNVTTKIEFDDEVDDELSNITSDVSNRDVPNENQSNYEKSDNGQNQSVDEQNQSVDENKQSVDEQNQSVDEQNQSVDEQNQSVDENEQKSIDKLNQKLFDDNLPKIRYQGYQGYQKYRY